MNADSGLLQRIFSSTHTQTLLNFFAWARQLLYGVIVLGTFAALIISITKLAKSAGSPVERARALDGILAACVCLTCLGGIGVVYVLLLSFIA